LLCALSLALLVGWRLHTPATPAAVANATP
jgi:hypothetical protein